MLRKIDADRCVLNFEAGRESRTCGLNKAVGKWSRRCRRLTTCSQVKIGRPEPRASVANAKPRRRPALW